MQGWTVREYNDRRAVLINRSFGSILGHLLIAALTVWWSAGLVNVAYLLYKYYVDADKWVIRPEGQDPPAATPSGEAQP